MHMAVKEYPAGKILAQSGQAINALHVIAGGTVRAAYPGGEFYLTKGDVIGACELFYDSYLITYQADDAVSIASYAYSGAQLPKILGNAEMAGRLVASMFRQLQEILDQYELATFDCDNFYHYLMNSYDEYLSLCGKRGISARALPGLESLTALVLEEDIDAWTGGYYTQLRALVASRPIREQSVDFLRGLLMKTSRDVHEILSVCRVLYDYKSDITNLLMSENRLDFFDLYASLLYKIGPHADESTSVIASISTMMIQLESQPSIDKEMYRARVAEYRERLADLDKFTEDAAADDGTPKDVPEIHDSINTILSYSQIEEEDANEFRNAVNSYRKLSDKNNSDDASRKLRLHITKLFYQIYEKAFLRSLKDFDTPKVVKMFLNFGYVDEQLAGMENAAYLYSIVDRLPSDPERGVYTIYEWLRAIYDGKKSPSRNEFDTDYQAYVHELKISGKIKASEEATMLKDTKRQVLFELHNMFQSGNKITFGRISSFCPLFSEHNILKDLEKSLVSADRIAETFRQIRAIDFSAYYRDMIYTNPKLGIGKEEISVEILPDLILMPNVGVRGVMWQEIEGRKRTTPARMMISIFQMEDLTNILVRLTGDFRWEMCKRVQGARWNDISEPSLTSRYFDYIQFYRKNRDLSADAKDKIKLNMQKAKNSFKEMFIRDYTSWVLYEGAGSPRLNKIARSILFDFCPFSREIRGKLKANPLYKETMERYDVKLAQHIHHYDNLFQKLSNIGAEIPPEIQAQRDYLNM